MRPEYLLMQDLSWNATFRREFLAGPVEAVKSRFPDIGQLERYGPTQFAGIEESAYYRIASCCRATKVHFPRGHHLLLAFGGLPFFEQLLEGYLDAQRPTDAVYELFDSYILAPEIINVARHFAWANDAQWIVPLLEYEWARLHAGRVANGWKSRIPTKGLLPGCLHVVHADYDLRALLSDLDRMIAASVPDEVYRWRSIPGRGSFHVAVYPLGDQIGELELDESMVEIFEHVTEGQIDILSDEVKEALVDAGLISSRLS
jgi:hypothetical protein